MARIRSIKPEFWTDEKVVALSPLARLLFIGMWNFVDDYGRADYSPTRLKMQILPADSAEIGGLLGEIAGAALINVYSIDGKQYFEVRGFTKHQKVDRRVRSKIPDPPQSAPSSAASPQIPPTDQGVEGIKEGIKEKKEEDAASGLKNGKDPYAFKCGVVKLNLRDLNRWIDAFPDVSVKAELTASADWLSKQPSWFSTAANMLAKKQREARKTGPPRPPDEPEKYYDSMLGWVERG